MEGIITMKIIQNIAVAIDTLRINKGLTVSELCFEICDDSAYRKYKTGKRNISIEKINLFCNRLGIGLDEFLYNLVTKNSYEYERIQNLYYALQDKDYIYIKKSLPHINVKEIGSEKNHILFSFILYSYQYETKNITKTEYYSMLSDLLPIHNGFYTFNDILILDKLAWLESYDKLSVSLVKLQTILLDTKKLYTISDNHITIATIFASVSNLLTKSKELSYAVEICKTGINYCKKYSITENIHHLYYLLAYNQFRDNKKESAMENLSIVISIVFSLQDKKEFTYFISLITKEFGLSKAMIYQMHHLALQTYL
jgi:transcriptional regulator with XRE-family HTH domain